MYFCVLLLLCFVSAEMFILKGSSSGADCGATLLCFFFFLSFFCGFVPCSVQIIDYHRRVVDD